MQSRTSERVVYAGSWRQQDWPAWSACLRHMQPWTQRSTTARHGKGLLPLLENLPAALRRQAQAHSKKLGSQRPHQRGLKAATAAMPVTACCAPYASRATVNMTLKLDPSNNRPSKGRRPGSAGLGLASGGRHNWCTAEDDSDPDTSTLCMRQGMNFLAALLLVWLPREDAAYGALVVLMRDRGLRSLYGADLAMLQVAAHHLFCSSCADQHSSCPSCADHHLFCSSCAAHHLFCSSCAEHLRKAALVAAKSETDGHNVAAFTERLTPKQ